MITRKLLGTASSNVVKLRRVWPEYATVWRSRCGVSLEGARIWMHEPGATPFAPLAAYVLTGNAGLTTSREQPILDRYIARSVNAVMDAGLACDESSRERVREIEGARWRRSWPSAVRALGGEAISIPSAGSLPLSSDSVDLCHSGGVLEHYRPEVLAGFLRECHRILRPGGIASHVVDHRDHLYHADKRIPFAAHLVLSEPIYEALLGHPLGYHNRLSPTDLDMRFEEAGFERIAVRRMILPPRTYVADEEVATGEPGSPRWLLAPRFRDISEPDLATAAAHYLFRKR